MHVLDAAGTRVPNVYALGDCASIKDLALPATAQVAAQQGTYLGKGTRSLARTLNAHALDAERTRLMLMRTGRSLSSPAHPPPPPIPSHPTRCPKRSAVLGRPRPRRPAGPVHLQKLRRAGVPGRLECARGHAARQRQGQRPRRLAALALRLLHHDRLLAQQDPHPRLLVGRSTKNARNLACPLARVEVGSARTGSRGEPEGRLSCAHPPS